MSNSLWPHELQHARLPCPSPSPGACSNSCPLSRWCHPNTSSSAAPFSFYLQSFPASGSFPISKVFALGVQSPHFIYIVGSLQRQQGGSSCLIKLISLTFFLLEAHHTLLVLRTPGSPSGLHVGAILYSKTAKKSSKIAKKKKKKNETLNIPQKGCLLRVWVLKPESRTSLQTPHLDTCMDFVTMSALTWKQHRCPS